MEIPFTQTQIWARINQYFNRLDPTLIEHSEIKCLFGIDKKNSSLTSFNGPIASEEISAQEFNDFLKKVLKTAKENRILDVNFRSLPPMRQWNLGVELEFLKMGFKKQEWQTFIVDLRASEENLLKSFDHSARKGIKKTTSLGVLVERCDRFEKFFKRFLIPYCNATKREIKEKKFYENGWDLDTENVYNYWTAQTEQGEPLGFLGTYRYNSVATEIMSSLTPLALERKIPVQDLLHWEIMRYHKTLGDSYFDLAGFNPNPISEKEKNIKRFKQKWEGEVYDVSSYTFDGRSYIKKLILSIAGKIYA